MWPMWLFLEVSAQAIDPLGLKELRQLKHIADAGGDVRAAIELLLKEAPSVSEEIRKELEELLRNSSAQAFETADCANDAFLRLAIDDLLQRYAPKKYPETHTAPKVCGWLGLETGSQVLSTCSDTDPLGRCSHPTKLEVYGLHLGPSSELQFRAVLSYRDELGSKTPVRTYVVTNITPTRASIDLQASIRPQHGGASVTTCIDHLRAPVLELQYRKASKEPSDAHIRADLGWNVFPGNVLAALSVEVFEGHRCTGMVVEHVQGPTPCGRGCSESCRPVVKATDLFMRENIVSIEALPNDKFSEGLGCGQNPCDPCPRPYTRVWMTTDRNTGQGFFDLQGDCETFATRFWMDCDFKNEQAR